MATVLPSNCKLYICTDHDSHWPVGVASLVIAHDVDEARTLLDAALREHGLKPFTDEPYTLQETYFQHPGAVVLRDGDY